MTSDSEIALTIRYTVCTSSYV